jgi:hypothetical protein
MKKLILSFSLACMALAAAQAQQEKPEAAPANPEPSPAQVSTAVEKPAEPAAAAPVATPDAANPATGLATRNHILQPLDKVAFFIEQDPAPVASNERRTLDLAVSAQGQLEVPVSRCCEQALVFDVKGKSIEQAEKEIREGLMADFYKLANVQLRLVDTTKRVGQVWLRGAVKGNTFQLPPGRTFTLWEVLTAVGTQEFANRGSVQLERRNPATGKVEITKVDIEAVDKGKRDLDVELQDGDRIYVKEKWFNLK